MGVICFGSLKGGVGKTSLSVNVAHAFAERGCEVLIIDLDPMGHASRLFLGAGGVVNHDSRQGAAQDLLEPKLNNEDLVSFIGDSKDPVAAPPKNAKSNNGVKSIADGSITRTGVGSQEFGVVESPLARLFLTAEPTDSVQAKGSLQAGSVKRSPQLGSLSIVERALEQNVSLIKPVRPQLSLVSSGPELRHFLWGRGARLFKDFFPELLEELSTDFDYIIVDTPPDFNVLTRNAIASSDIVVVPVDSSAMSIHCLEEIVSSSNHIEGPVWAIVRSMVTKQASRMQQMTADRIQESVKRQDTSVCSLSGDTNYPSGNGQFEPEDITDPEGFISLVEREGREKIKADVDEGEHTKSPIYLLHSIIYRSEQLNKLTFKGRTAFDSKGDSAVKDQYLSVSRELEALLSLSAESDPLLNGDESFSLSSMGL